MAGKNTYLSEIKAQHPDLSEELLELAWHLHDVKKARHYGALLNACTDYPSIVHRVVRTMYVMDEIDAQKAKNEKFLDLLVSMACLEKPGNGHAAVYYVRPMLNEKEVKAERARYKEHCRQHRWLSQSKFPDQLVVQLQLVVRDANTLPRLLDYLLSVGGTIMQATAEPEGSSLCGESASIAAQEPSEPNLYAVTCPWTALPGLLSRLGDA